MPPMFCRMFSCCCWEFLFWRVAVKRSTISKIELHRFDRRAWSSAEEIFGLKMHGNFLIGPSNNNHLGNMAHAKLFPLFGRYGPEKPTALLN